MKNASISRHIVHDAPTRTDKLAPVRRPERARAPQRNDADACVLCARVQQHVQVELFEQPVVRRGAAECYEAGGDDDTWR